MNRIKLETMPASALRLKIQSNLKENEQIGDELRRRQSIKDELDVLTDEELEEALFPKMKG